MKTKQNLNYCTYGNFDWRKQEVKDRTRIVSRNYRKQKRGFWDYIRTLLF